MIVWIVQSHWLYDGDDILGIFTDEEKAQMISKTAKAFGSVAGKKMEQFTSVRIVVYKFCARAFSTSLISIRSAPLITRLASVSRRRLFFSS